MASNYLTMNNPFMDGYKRVALAATRFSLRLNGFNMNRLTDAVFSFMIGLFSKVKFERKTIENRLWAVVTG